jgi:hypothetical protein
MIRVYSAAVIAGFSTTRILKQNPSQNPTNLICQIFVNSYDISWIQTLPKVRINFDKIEQILPQRHKPAGGIDFSTQMRDVATGIRAGDERCCETQITYM